MPRDSSYDIRRIRFSHCSVSARVSLFPARGPKQVLRSYVRLNSRVEFTRPDVGVARCRATLRASLQRNYCSPVLIVKFISARHVPRAHLSFINVPPDLDCRDWIPCQPPCARPSEARPGQATRYQNSLGPEPFRLAINTNYASARFPQLTSTAKLVACITDNGRASHAFLCPCNFHAARRATFTLPRRELENTREECTHGRKTVVVLDSRSFGKIYLFMY